MFVKGYNCTLLFGTNDTSWKIRYVFAYVINTKEIKDDINL